VAEVGLNRRSSDDVSKASVAYLQRKRHVSRPRGSRAQAPVVHRSEISEAEIDKTLADSFPASDPPSWNSGVDRQMGG
jgi:hypothetical protein